MKAIGSGMMAYGLEQVEFLHDGWNNIRAKVGGEILKEWRFWLSEMGNRHCVSFTLHVLYGLSFECFDYRFRIGFEKCSSNFIGLTEKKIKHVKNLVELYRSNWIRIQDMCFLNVEFAIVSKLLKL